MVDPGLVSLAELAVLTVGVAIAVMEIRNMSETRKTEVILQFYDKFTSRINQENIRHVLIEQRFDSIEEWAEKYGPITNPDAYLKWLTLMNMFNSCGHILKKGLADLEDIYNYNQPLGIIAVWEKFKPLIEDRRRQYNFPEFFESAEYFYNETKKRYPQLTTRMPYQQ